MASYFLQLVLAGLQLLAVHIIVGPILGQAQKTNVSFTNFSFANFSSTDNFLNVSDAQHNASDFSFLLNHEGTLKKNYSCGKLLYKEKVRMKFDSTSGAVASFNTAFTFQIIGQRNIQGDFDCGAGLAFTFARNDTLLDESLGASLCLLKKANNGLASNRLFAVEFDTWKNPEFKDPSDSHIGVNINSMTSTWSSNLCGTLSSCSSLCNKGYFTAWIYYDSLSQKLEVFFAQGSLYDNITKPSNSSINEQLKNLAELVDDYMYVGFSGSGNAHGGVQQIRSWKFTSLLMPELRNDSSPRRKVGKIAGVSVGVVGVLFVVGFFISARYRMRTTHPGGQPPMNLVSQSMLSSQHRAAGDNRNPSALEKLELYLALAEECMEAVQKVSNSRKFNDEQCGYLINKLKDVVPSARLFLEKQSCSSVDSNRLVETFKLLVASAKQTENFVQGCRKDEWIQAAMTLTNVSEYVASLGFNLELCKIAFSATKCLTQDEVGNINEAEVEMVEQKASLDANALLLKVISELKFLEGENRDLATFLLQRLLRIVQPNPSSEEAQEHSGNLLLFNWVRPTTARQLGSGASATVHEAIWLGTPVAQKTFEGENLDVVNEVEILSQLYHPNITSMFCYSKSKRDCSIIMELMDEDLHKLIRRRCSDGGDSPFSILEAVDIMLQIGEGVKYLHTKRIVHRDLKSMNILIKKLEDVGYVHAKVSDFGLSKLRNKSKYSDWTINVGTTRWMPPEIMILPTDAQKDWLSGSKKVLNLDPFKCDTYSFGMVCYEILSGFRPFYKISNPKEIRRRILDEYARPSIHLDCPSILKDLIEKCWSQNPEERPTFDFICLELKYLKYILITGSGDGMLNAGNSFKFPSFSSHQE